MKKLLLLFIVPVIAVIGRAPAGQAGPLEGAGYRTEGPVRFVPLQIRIDPGGSPLAAYQFELKAAKGRIRIVGVEGGSDPAFGRAPYYDPAALAQDRIVIAAYSLDGRLPTGPVRVATIHLQVQGDVEPEYELTLDAAADDHGDSISAKITHEQGEVQ